MSKLKSFMSCPKRVIISAIRSYSKKFL